MDKTTTSQENSLLMLYLKSIAEHKNLSAAEEAQLAARIQKGDGEALALLVKSNLRFVVNVAKSYRNQGIPLADLINEGNLGLIRAAKRFDGSKNFKFITYAVWWIRQAILKALAEQSRIVKLPLNRVGTLYKIGKTQVNLEQKYGRFPTPREIAEQLELPQKEVEEALQIGNTAVSFDAPVQKTGEGNLHDFMTSDEQEMPDDSMNKISLSKEIESIMSHLDERERKILELYFGLHDQEPCTLEEIGKRFRLTRERARQIKQKALSRLKNSTRKQYLRSYYR